MGGCKQFSLAGAESVEMKKGTQRAETRKGSCGDGKMATCSFPLINGVIEFPVSSLKSESLTGLALANEKLINMMQRRGLKNACP